MFNLKQNNLYPSFLLLVEISLVSYEQYFIPKIFFPKLDAQFDEPAASVSEPLQHDTSAGDETVQQLQPAAAVPGQRHVLFTSCSTVTHQPAVCREPSQPAATRDTA